MRISSLLVLSVFLVPVGCKSDDGTSGGDSDTGSGSDSGDSTGGDETNSGSASDSDSSSESSSSESESESGSGSSTGSGSATDTGTATDSSSSSTGGGDTMCDETVQIDLDADAAVLDGWTEQMSMMGEGAIIVPDNGDPANTATFTIDIPCDDDFYVWAKGFDQGGADSLFVTVDGEPMMGQAIFEFDCSNMGNGYVWNDLNWRDPMDQACIYLQDPWIQTWTVGAHDVVFMPRESAALSEIIITNDPMFDPNAP